MYNSIISGITLTIKYVEYRIDLVSYQ